MVLDPLVMLTLLPGTGGSFDVIAPRTPRAKLRIFHAELHQQNSRSGIRTVLAKSGGLENTGQRETYSSSGAVHPVNSFGA
jgi:hypothetical protein